MSKLLAYYERKEENKRFLHGFAKKLQEREAFKNFSKKSENSENIVLESSSSHIYSLFNIRILTKSLLTEESTKKCNPSFE